MVHIVESSVVYAHLLTFLVSVYTSKNYYLKLVYWSNILKRQKRGSKRHNNIVPDFAIKHLDVIFAKDPKVVRVRHKTS